MFTTFSPLTVRMAAPFTMLRQVRLASVCQWYVGHEASPRGKDGVQSVGVDVTHTSILRPVAAAGVMI